MDVVICRICLSEADSDNFQTLFTSVEIEDSKTSMHLSEMICSFSQVQITLGDGLPENICTKCAEQTIHFYLFKTRCEENDKILRKKLLKISKNTGIEIQGIKFEPTVDRIERTPICEFGQDISRFCCDDSMSDNDDQTNDMYQEDIIVEKTKKPKEFECNVCQKKFTREDLLLRHKIAHARKMKDFEEKADDTNSISAEHIEYVKCERGENEIVEIDGTFAMDDTSNVIIINNEYCQKLPNIYLNCDLCSFKSLHKDYFEKHIFDVHLNMTETSNRTYYMCKICNSEVKDLNYFKQHVKEGHIKNNSYRKSIKRDVRNLTKEKDSEFYCNHCGKVFKSKKYLTKHINRHKLNKNIVNYRKPHICEICFKAFNQISNLKDHLRTHNGEKPFLCATCGKGFNQLGNLRQHQIRHSGVKSHVCPTCNHGFASKGELHAHLRKHTGARPFVCDVCGNGFTTSSSLTKHKRIHSGEKPYECEYCKMKFSRSGILSRHRRIHTGEKPYVCEICSKAFTQSNDLNSHIRIHSGEKPYKCDHCSQRFRQSSALRTHKKTHLEPKPHVKQASQKKDRPIFVEEEENLLIKFTGLPVPV